MTMPARDASGRFLPRAEPAYREQTQPSSTEPKRDKNKPAHEEIKAMVEAWVDENGKAPGCVLLGRDIYADLVRGYAQNAFTMPGHALCLWTTLGVCVPIRRDQNLGHEAIVLLAEAP